MPVPGLKTMSLGDSVKRAQETAYRAVHQVQFEGRQYRSDIGWRALPHESN